MTNSRHVLITSHISPDGDALGSTIALGTALKALAINTTLFIEGTLPAVYQFLPRVCRVVSHFQAIRQFDTAVILDCGDITRIGKNYPKVAQIPFIINLDHHITNTIFGHLNLVDTSACATAEIVFRLIKALGVTITPTIATCLYTGILTDTGSFRFSNTNPAAFEISRELVEAGADPYEVARYVYGAYSTARIRLLNMALGAIELSENGSLSMMTLTRSMHQKTGTRPEDAADLINYAREIKGVKVAVLIQECGYGNGQMRYHVSLRSNGGVDVAQMATTFGGGGHPAAAGFTTTARLDDIKSKLFHLAKFL